MNIALVSCRHCQSACSHKGVDRTVYCRDFSEPDIVALLLSALTKCHSALENHPGGDSRSIEDYAETADAIAAANNSMKRGE